MNLFTACEVLDIWPMAKARAEVWSVSNNHNAKSLNNLKTIAKNKFREIAQLHHPDKGGDHNKYIYFQDAHNIIKESDFTDFINALKDDMENSKVYCDPGSLKCKDCTKWSDIVGLCVTVSCTGLKSLKDSNVYSFDQVRKQGNKVQNSSFIKKRSNGMGQATG